MVPRISSIGHVGIYAEDLDRSIAFYRDLLGLTVTDYDEAGGMCFMSSRPDEEHHEFLLCRGRTAPRDARLLQQISFRCPTFADVIAYYERMKAHGVEFDRIVTHGNAVGVYFFDPDHNRCEVYWPTGWPARQTFLAAVDLTRPPDDILRDVRELVDRYGASGFVDPGLLRN